MIGGQNRHFAPEEWVDFVNGTLPADHEHTLETHLAAVCDQCSQVAERWRRVRTVAQRERNYEAPESAVRYVLNAFAVVKPQEKQKFFTIPRLVFDSLWLPAPVGVRSAVGVPRHLTYRAGEIAIEMQLEPVANSERLSVAGQISSTSREGQGLSGIPVAVVSKDHKVGESTTNKFGEFQLSFVPQGPTQISFGTLDGRDITIPLEGAQLRRSERK
jgi:hypothetical protein